MLGPFRSFCVFVLCSAARSLPPPHSSSVQNMGTASFSGPGAGRYPTANSVVNDIVRLGTGKVGSPFPFDKVRLPSRGPSFCCCCFCCRCCCCCCSLLPHLCMYDYLASMSCLSLCCSLVPVWACGRSGSWRRTLRPGSTCASPASEFFLCLQCDFFFCDALVAFFFHLSYHRRSTV